MIISNLKNSMALSDFGECLPHVRAREGKVARERGCGALLRVDNRLAT